MLLHVAFGGHRWDAWLALGWASRKMEKTVQASALSSKCPLGRDGGHFGQLYSPPFPTLSLPSPDLNRVMSYDPARSVLRLTDAQELRLPAWPLVTPTRPLGGCVLSKLLGRSLFTGASGENLALGVALRVGCGHLRGGLARCPAHGEG